MQVEVHNAEPSGRRHDLPSSDAIRPEMTLLIGIQSCSVLTDYIFMGGEEKSARTAGGIAYGVLRTWSSDVHDCFNQFARREVLARALRGILC